MSPATFKHNIPKQVFALIEAVNAERVDRKAMHLKANELQKLFSLSDEDMVYLHQSITDY